MMTWLTCYLLPCADMMDGQGGHRYFEPSKLLLSLSRPTVPADLCPGEAGWLMANRSTEPSDRAAVGSGGSRSVTELVRHVGPARIVALG